MVSNTKTIDAWMHMQKEGIQGKCVYADNDGTLYPYTHEMFSDDLADRIETIVHAAGWRLRDLNTFRDNVGHMLYEHSVWTGSQKRTTPTYVSIPSKASESRVLTKPKTSWNVPKQERS